MPTIKRLKKQNRKIDTFRVAERQKIYNTRRWAKLRAVKFRMNPLCERCAEGGRVIPAEDIHHIVSFMSADDPIRRAYLAFDFDNLMSLCKKCHQAIHNGVGLKKRY